MEEIPYRVIQLLINMDLVQPKQLDESPCIHGVGSGAGEEGGERERDSETASERGLGW